MVEVAVPRDWIHWRDWAWVPARAALVGATVFLSAAIPSVERVCALTGSLAFSFLCFVLPGALFLKLQPRPDATLQRALAALFIPLGLVLGVWGFVATLLDPRSADADTPLSVGQRLSPRIHHANETDAEEVVRLFRTLLRFVSNATHSHPAAHPHALNLSAVTDNGTWWW